MQCLIEELQSQVLPSPEPQRSEGEEEHIPLTCSCYSPSFLLYVDKMSTPSVTTTIPSPDEPAEPEPSPMQPIVVSTRL